MKKLLLLALALSSSIFAAEVLEAKLDASQENIEVTVKYGGGCKEHDFTLKFNECNETMPVQCVAEIVETVVDGPDHCRALITTVATFNLAKTGLIGDYHKNASIKILGDATAEERSSATVTLP